MRQFSNDIKPFKNNKSTYIKNGVLTRESLEQAVGEAINKHYVKTIAVGNPAFPVKSLLSSTCVYIPNSNWKNIVRILIKKAKLIVIKVANTDSSIWELDYCVKNDYWEKTIFLVDSIDNFNLLNNYLYLNNSCINEKEIPLFIFYMNKEWHINSVEKKEDVEQLIEIYTEFNLDAIQHNMNRKQGLQLLRKEQIPSIIYQYISFLLMPPLYLIYNKWSLKYNLAFILYVILFAVSFGYLSLELLLQGNYLYLYMLFELSLLPWLFFITKISYYSSNWGGKYLFGECQKSLAFWSIAFYIPIVIIDLIL